MPPLDDFGLSNILEGVDTYLRKSLHLAASGRPLIFFDTETTGLNLQGPNKSIAWQIGYVRRGNVRPDSEEMAGEIVLKIEETLDPVICKICEVQPDHPQKFGYDPVTVLKKFAAKLDGAIPIGQNSDEFDFQILRNTYERYGVPLPPELAHVGIGYSIDTLFLAKSLYNKAGTSGPPNLKLVTLGEHLKCQFDPNDLHHALADVRLTAAVFDNFIRFGEKIFTDELYQREVSRRTPR